MPIQKAASNSNSSDAPRGQESFSFLWGQSPCYESFCIYLVIDFIQCLHPQEAQPPCSKCPFYWGELECPWQSGSSVGENIHVAVCTPKLKRRGNAPSSPQCVCARPFHTKAVFQPEPLFSVSKQGYLLLCSCDCFCRWVLN